MKEIAYRGSSVEEDLEFKSTALGDSTVNVAMSTFGPDGNILTMADLPSPNTKRWVIRRKAEVVAGVKGGLLSLSDACERYRLTVDEFLSWQHAIRRYGLDGLRATRAQQQRDALLPGLRASHAKQFRDTTQR